MLKMNDHSEIIKQELFYNEFSKLKIEEKINTLHKIIKDVSLNIQEIKQSNKISMC